jgi:1-acyl-sn-glycerol-3-phosphate acyltransferase
MGNILQLIRSAIFTVLLFLVTGVFGVIVLIGAALPLTLKQRYAIPRTWGLLLTWLAGVVCGLHYTVEGQENLPNRPFISLWKHSSAWETMAQMFVVPPAAWLLKREVIWIPIVGWAVSTYKPIAINRSAGHSAVQQVVKQGRERLAAGMGVIVYPEGTRVTPGATRKYGVSGALLACETGTPVVPIAHNSGYFWRRRSLLKKPGMIRVVIGPPIDPTGLTPREVNERAQQWIEAKVAELVAKPRDQSAKV